MKINVKQIMLSFLWFLDNEGIANHDNLEVIQPLLFIKEAEWCGCQGEPGSFIVRTQIVMELRTKLNICAREN